MSNGGKSCPGEGYQEQDCFRQACSKQIIVSAILGTDLNVFQRDVPGWVRTLKIGLDLEPFLMFALGKNAPSNAPWIQLAQCGLGTMKMQEDMPSNVLL